MSAHQQLEVGIAEDRPAKATPEPDELGAEATTRSSTPAPDPAPSLSTPWWNGRLSSLLLAGVVTAAGAGISAGFGVARIPLPVLVVASAVIAGVIFCVTNCLTSSEANDKIQLLAWAVAGEALLLLGAFGYHELVDRASTTYSLTVRTDSGLRPDLSYIPLFGEPAGQPQNLETGAYGQNGLVAGQTYDIFECSAKAPDGSMWLRYHRRAQSASQTWWAPRELLKAPAGTANLAYHHVDYALGQFR